MAMSWKPRTFAEPTKQQRRRELHHLISLTNAKYLMFPDEDVFAWIQMCTSRFYEMVNNIWHIMEGICLPTCTFHKFVVEYLAYVANYLDKGVAPNAFTYCIQCIIQLLKSLKHLYTHHFADYDLVGPCLQEIKIVYGIIYSFGMENSLISQGDVPELQPLGHLRHLISQTNAQYLMFPDEDLNAWIQLRTARFYEIVQSIRYNMEGICRPNCGMHEFVVENLAYVGNYLDQGVDPNAFMYCAQCIIKLLKCLKHFYVHHFVNDIIVGPCLQELKIVYKIIYSFGMERHLINQGDVPVLQPLEDLRHLISLTNAQYLMYPAENAPAWLQKCTARFYEMVQSIRGTMEGVCHPHCGRYKFVVDSLTYVGKYLDKGFDPKAFRHCPQCMIKLLKCLKHFYVHHFANEVLVGPCLPELKSVHEIIYNFAKEKDLISQIDDSELALPTKVVLEGAVAETCQR